MKFKITAWFCASILLSCFAAEGMFFSDEDMLEPHIFKRTLPRPFNDMVIGLDSNIELRFKNNEQNVIEITINCHFANNNFDKLNIYYNLSRAFNKTQYFNTEELFKKSLECYNTNPEVLSHQRIAYFAQLYFSEKLQQIILKQRDCDANFSWQ